MFKLRNILFAVFCLLMGYHSYGQNIPESVELSGKMKRINGKFWLEADDHKMYLLSYHEADTLKYIDHRVKVSGFLLQGYNNPKYGNQNLPIEQIDPKDIINIITSARLLGLD